MLQVRSLTKKYGSFTALESVSLDFENGVYALLAPNGAGKTTLIKMITTLLFPTEGEILYDGTDIFALGEEYRAKIGYLPQQFGFYRNYTPVQFLSYLAALKGLDKEITDRKIPELMEMVALSDSMNKKLKTFSGGMLQRVGIAQAMLNDPDILVLDEPTAGLDPKERVRFRNLISALSKDRTVILSTHIVSDIEAIANKVIMFKDHRLLCCEEPADICAMVDGMIYETDRLDKLTTPYLLLSEKQESDRLLSRIACETPPDVSICRPVKASMEDAFLFIYRGENE